MSDKVEATEKIWIDPDEAFYYVDEYKRDDDIKYYRADKYRTAVLLVELLYHWLFEITDKFVPFISDGVLSKNDYEDIMYNADDALKQYNEWRDANP